MTTTTTVNAASGGRIVVQYGEDDGCYLGVVLAPARGRRPFLACSTLTPWERRTLAAALDPERLPAESPPESMADAAARKRSESADTAISELIHRHGDEYEHLVALAEKGELL